MSTLRNILFIVFLIALPISAVAQSYISNATCRSCHKKQFNEWEKSDHYHSMLPAIRENVLGNFNNVIFTHEQDTIKFFIKDDQYFISITNQSGKTKTYLVKYTFGYKPLQQYLIEQPKGKLQAFTIAWDNEKKRWFDLQEGENVTEASPLHWSKRFYNWNHSCADCHSTNFQKNFDGSSYQSDFSGVNVNCQACHGPGQQHVNWAQGKIKTAQNKGFPIDFESMTTQQMTQSCAQCHSRRTQVSEKYDHRKAFMDMYIPATLRPKLYYSDGQIKDEVFVYGSFVQSKMYRAGVKCTNCHNPHTLQLKYSGNAVCTQCHSVKLIKTYSGLKNKNYDSEDHSHHQKGSSGAQCVACHMPATNFMKIDPRRDHSFKIPNPALTSKYNIPNACNGCHQKKSEKWALRYLTRWFGKSDLKPSLLNDDQQALIAMAKDAFQPEIFRASAISLIQPKDKESVATIIEGLSNKNPMVRLAAVNAMSNFSLALKMKHIKPLLNDDVLTVRAIAASLLLDVDRKQFSSTDKKLFQKAIEEYFKIQKANRDQPEAHFNLAQAAFKQNDVKKTIDELKKAINIDQHFIPAYIWLSKIYNLQNKNQLALEWLEKGISSNRNNAELHYYLGLLAAEQQQYQLALVNLKKAWTLNPKNPRAAYNLSSVYLKLDKQNKAIAVLKKANTLFPKNTDIINNLIYIYLKQNNTSQALNYVKKKLEIEPRNKQAYLLYQRLLNGMD